MGSEENDLIAFQGEPGANGDLACRVVRENMQTLPCHTFEDTFAAVHRGEARLLLIPIDNTVAGRVADIHHLLPESGLHIIGEHFQRVEHHLLAVKGAKLKDLTHVHSHVHALNQCRKAVQGYDLEPMVHVDTAAAAREISERGEKNHAAIASELAGSIYGLKSLRANIEDADHNTTRFLLMAREPLTVTPDEKELITSFVFRVRNVSAALYKALGGFATNQVNLTKLESFSVKNTFDQANFYLDLEGHLEQPGVKKALEELGFHTKTLDILGVYESSIFRQK